MNKLYDYNFKKEIIALIATVAIGIALAFLLNSGRLLVYSVVALPLGLIYAIRRRNEYGKLKKELGEK